VDSGWCAVRTYRPPRWWRLMGNSRLGWSARAGRPRWRSTA